MYASSYPNGMKGATHIFDPNKAIDEEEATEIRHAIRRKVKGGELGRKTCRGWYEYEGDEIRKEK